MSLDRTQKTQKSTMKGSSYGEQFTSCDAPPLDFSFKNITNLQQLKNAVPRNGIRKQINHTEQIKQKKLVKEQSMKQQKQEQIQPQKQQQKQADKKITQITRLAPQNNINTIITNLVTNANLKNISGKNNEQKNLDKKKTVKVKLECVSLILGYNKLRNIDGLYSALTIIMPNYTNLQWLDLSHNYLQNLNYDFKQITKLRTLYLHCNYLYDINDLRRLNHLQNLKTLTIHGNALTSIPSFRLYVIGVLKKLKKLDSVVVSNKQRDNSNFWMKSCNDKLPVIKNYAKPPVESIEKQQNEYS